MSYLQTTASDVRNLLSVIKSFAQSDAWTVSYDAIAGSGQLGISKGNCFLSIGERPSENPIVRNDLVNGGTLNDAILNMVVNHSLNSGNQQYWGHPSSIVDSSNDDEPRVRVNDVYGAFSNVWLMSNATETHIWVITQQGGDRFNVFGFGILDKKGMTHPNVGFCVGTQYIWWPDDADYTANSFCDFNYPKSGNHSVGLFAESQLGDQDCPNLMCFLPDGVVNPIYGFTDGPFQTKNFYKIMNRGDSFADHTANAEDGAQLDYFLAIENQETTGGVPLHGLTIRYAQIGLATVLGDLPDIRLVNMGSLTPGQEITFGAETWKVFPLKRKGSRTNSNFGNSPQPYVNSIEYGFAIKKVV